ncbi:MAG TPA: DegQ family serine endoprotease [Acidiferrobacterales bacterium]|jgi:serine protease Do
MKRHFPARWAAIPVLLALAPAAGAAGRELPDFSTLVQANGPAVVNISTTQIQRRNAFPGLGTPDGAPFNDWFRHYFGEEGEGEAFDSKSLGSGFVITRDGYVLTCAHVVENAREVIVKLNDRREFAARVVGADRRSDVALLKIDAQGLPVVKIGDPAGLRVGEWVIAIGSPFGFESSATAGIVSAKGRSLPKENYVPFIQTDVAINPGNSGGPLFNLNGEVVGVNSQIYSRTGGFMGLSFAVPIDMAMQVVTELKAHGRVRRGWLGVTIQDVTRELAESFSMSRPAGALVADILPGSPGAKSELKIGDVVVDYEGQPIEVSSDLPPLVGRTPPGTRARMTVVRGGQTRNLFLTIGELPEERTEAPPEGPADVPALGPLGLAYADLNPRQRRELGIPAGVLIERVGDGPGLRAGLRPGDVLLQVDGRPVRNSAELTRLLGQLPRDRALPILIRRGSNAQFLALKIGE